MCSFNRLILSFLPFAPVFTAAADAGNAAEDPGADAHPEGSVLTPACAVHLCHGVTLLPDLHA